jgi:4a-hydroxytetrahydrobiopterin dehydratase
LKLSPADVAQRLKGLGGWAGDGDAIRKQYTFANFIEAIAFVNRLAAEAEAADHHPDLLVHGYKHLRVTLSTHAAGGLTDRDFALASKVDALAGRL